MCTTSSILSHATMRASRRCMRSCAFLRSNFVRRIVTSCLCSTKYFTQSFNVRRRGRPLTRAMLLTENELCRAVILKSLLRMTLALASFLQSTTIRIPSRPVSSLTFDMPVILPSLTRSAIDSMSCALFTPYGISVTTILSCISSLSISALARITTRPRPVSYASLTPCMPYMYAPVGKSGALIYSMSPSVSISGLSMYAQHPSMTSLRLCVGMFVAIPTAMPLPPFTRRLGIFVGITVGSCSESSKLLTISTVFFSRSSIICSPIFDSLHSV